MAKKGKNIYKRKDGRWEGRYIKGYDLSGKIRYGYVYGKTFREAHEKQTKAQADLLNRSAPTSNSKKILADYCGEWLVINRSRVKKSTYIKYRNTVQNYIVPRLGSCMPQFISTAVLENFSHELLVNGALQKDGGLSPKTVRDILTILHSILKYAKKQGGCKLSDFEIIYPKETKKEMRVLSREEQDRLVRYLLTDLDNCKFGILLTLMTGMRIGEICALRWQNISLPDRTVQVGATMQRLQKKDPMTQEKTEILIDEPKSLTSKRIIPLMPQTVELCARMGNHPPQAFVLTGEVERFMEPRLMQYHFKKYTEACGLRDVNFHALRHTFATRCVEVDFEIKSLSEILGHASVEVTLDRYVHSSMELKRENMNKLPAIGF